MKVGGFSVTFNSEHHYLYVHPNDFITQAVCDILTDSVSVTVGSKIQRLQAHNSERMNYLQKMYLFLYVLQLVERSQSIHLHPQCKTSQLALHGFSVLMLMCSVHII